MPCSVFTYATRRSFDVYHTDVSLGNDCQVCFASSATETESLVLKSYWKTRSSKVCPQLSSAPSLIPDPDNHYVSGIITRETNPNYSVTFVVTKPFATMALNPQM